MWRFGLLLLIFSTPLQAGEICDDYWLARNAIFNATGVCFKSPLGQALFDNSDCTTSPRSLTSEEARAVARLRDAEKGCAVDTNRTTLDVAALEQRLMLREQPFRDDTESACLGYLGPELPIYDAPRRDAKIIGVIPVGSIIGNSHIPLFPIDRMWTFASGVYVGDEELPLTGWVADPSYWQRCAQVAG